MLEQFFKMEVETPAGKGEIGITLPALMAINSETITAETRLEATLSRFEDAEGFMHFFADEYLQAKYPPDMESTAMWLSGQVKAGHEPRLSVAKFLQYKNGCFFETWKNRKPTPVDYTSQLIMLLCMRAIGEEQSLKQISSNKMSTYELLSKPDPFYGEPLVFIYYSLFLEDLPTSFIEIVGRFLETYLPSSNTELLMMEAIKKKMNIQVSLHQVQGKRRPYFTNGNRKEIKYYSTAIDNILGQKLRSPLP